MRVELVDRFGAVPGEVENLLDVVIIKRLCREAGVERLEAGPKGMVIQFRKNRFANPAGLIDWTTRHKDSGVKIRPDHKVAIIREMTNATRITFAKKAGSAMCKLVRMVSEPS